MAAVYQILPWASLQRGRYQPRVDFASAQLAELAQSIKNQGLIEPIIVRNVAVDCYEIIAGERRWRAAEMAGLADIPCLVGAYSDKEAATLTLVENIQRQELTLIEEAKGYKRLIDEFAFHQEEIASLVGKSRSHIANVVRLLTLDSSVQSLIQSGALSFGHARVLVGMPINQQLSLAEQTIEQAWSVRQLEEKARGLKGNAALPVAQKKPLDIQYLENKLAEQIGAPVQIAQVNGQGGWLQVKFFDNDTLEGLLNRMGLHHE